MQFWSPHYQKDVKVLERVQRRFTRMLPSLVGVGYEERLNKLGLSSLERWRLWGDLIEVYKIMKGKDMAYSQRLFPRVEVSITRGHKFKVRGWKFKGDVGEGCFSHRKWWCLEHAAREGGGRRHISNIEEASGWAHEQGHCPFGHLHADMEHCSL